MQRTETEMKVPKEFLEHAVAEGMILTAYYEDADDSDYHGTDASKCLEALEACDVMHLILSDDDGKSKGWAMIVNECDGDPEEQIADYSGKFVNEWHEARKA
jgi:hypothetical protein